MAIEKNSLTELQKRFIEAYLGEARFNATKAARLAGYSGDDNVLAVTGHDNLRKHKIAAMIKKRLSESVMSADENLMHLSQIARGCYSPAWFLDDSGQLDSKKVNQYGYLIKSISFTSNGPKIELHDRMRALELIGKHHGIFTADNQIQNLNINLSELTNEQLERIANGEDPLIVIANV